MILVLKSLPSIPLIELSELQQQTWQLYRPKILSRLQFSVPHQLLKLFWLQTRYFPQDTTFREALVTRVYQLSDLITLRELRHLLQLMDDKLAHKLLLIAAKLLLMKSNTERKNMDYPELATSCYALLVKRYRALVRSSLLHDREQVKNYAEVMLPALNHYRSLFGQFIYELKPKCFSEACHSLALDPAFELTNERESLIAGVQKVNSKICEVLASRMNQFSFEELTLIAWSLCKQQQNYKQKQKQKVTEKDENLETRCKLEDELARRLQLQPNAHHAALSIWAFARYHALKFQTVQLLFQCLLVQNQPQTPAQQQREKRVQLGVFQLTMALYLANNLSPAAGVPVQFLLKEFLPQLESKKNLLETEQLVDCLMPYAHHGLIDQSLMDCLVQRCSAALLVASFAVLQKTRLLMLGLKGFKLGQQQLDFLGKVQNRIQEIMKPATNER